MHQVGQTRTLAERLGRWAGRWVGPRWKDSKAMLIAGAVGLLAASGTAWFYDVALDADQRRHLDSFGRASAEQLAMLSAEPMIGGDRISLGVLASQMEEPPEIAAVSIYTVDDRVLTITGTAPTDAPHFTHPIVFEDSVAGYARVVLNPSVFRTGPGALPLALWIVCCGLLGCLGAYLTLREWSLPRPGKRAPGNEEAIDEPASFVTTQPGYILVVNWFNQVTYAPAERLRILDLCMSRVDQVGSLYGAQCTELTGTGLLASFNGAPTDASVAERSFQVICAALLIADVLDSVNERQFMADRARLEFRFGLNQDRRDAPQGDIVGSDCTSDTVLLSAIAGNGSVAVSQEVFDQLDHADRFTCDEQRHAILASLTTATAGHCIVVSALEESYRSLLHRQAERLLDQPDSTSSPSTF